MLLYDRLNNSHVINCVVEFFCPFCLLVLIEGFLFQQSDSVVFDSLRRLQIMVLSVEVLKVCSAEL